MKILLLHQWIFRVHKLILVIRIEVKLSIVYLKRFIFHVSFFYNNWIQSQWKQVSPGIENSSEKFVYFFNDSYSSNINMSFGSFNPSSFDFSPEIWDFFHILLKKYNYKIRSKISLTIYEEYPNEISFLLWLFQSNKLTNTYWINLIPDTLKLAFNKRISE